MRSPLSAEAADKLIGSIDGTEVEISVEDINNKANKDLSNVNAEDLAATITEAGFVKTVNEVAANNGNVELTYEDILNTPFEVWENNSVSICYAMNVLPTSIQGNVLTVPLTSSCVLESHMQYQCGLSDGSARYMFIRPPYSSDTLYDNNSSTEIKVEGRTLTVTVDTYNINLDLANTKVFFASVYGTTLQPVASINGVLKNLQDGWSSGSVRSFGAAIEDNDYQLGQHAITIGIGTKASGEAQYVQGKFNIENADCAHIVGNGHEHIDEENPMLRSNAHTLDWNGNAWFAGDVYVGSTSGTNKDEGSVKLMSAADFETAELITIADINEICNASIVNASEVEF